jgi:tetratricopeptide (TPR) repeat protein
MPRFLLLCLWVTFAQTQTTQPGQPASLGLEKGKLLEHISCAQHPEQSYALYLPARYSPSRLWPIVYSFDPAAKGTVPVELQKDAAEHFGYILAASNNSKNGSWSVEADAADAMIRDTHARLSIDDRALYFAGFSGGARVASQLALICKCAAGVLLSGAGFPVNATPSRDTTFEVFSAVGTLDFNYQEVIPLQERLDQAGYPQWLYVFEGPHQWAPAEAMEQALAWFRVQAMKAKRQPGDAAFVAAQFSETSSHANSTERAGDLLAAWREYSQIVATFDGLVDVTALRAEADSLGKRKSVREAAKQEHKDFEEQTRLENDILASLPATSETAEPQSETLRTTENARDLRVRAAQDKHANRTRVYKRAVAGAFVGAMESGISYLDNRDYARATRAFSCATQAAPDSEWAWRNLALANGLNGNRKESLVALKRVRELTTDKAAFVEWAKTEPAFERIRSTREFQTLLMAN